MSRSEIPNDISFSGEGFSESSAPTSSLANGGLEDSGVGSTKEPQNVFQCEDCPKFFNRRENLSRHSKTHNALPSHSCSICGRGFTRSDLLKRHYIGHGRQDQPESNGFRPRKRRKLPLDPPDTPIPPLRGGREPISLENQGHDENHMIVYSPQRNSHRLQTQSSDIYSGLADESRGRESDQTSSQPHQASFEIMSNNAMPNYIQLDAVDPSLISFDFSNFLLPTEMDTIGNEWFSYDFYSAMRETGNAWEGQSPENYNQSIGVRPSDQVECETGSPNNNQEPPETISHVSSPPNESSEEDKWPFQWNPNSRRILEAQPLILEDDHPLFRNHDSRYDISETTLMRIKSFLTLPPGREYHQSQQGIFTLPSLSILNIFIRLFFQQFSHQMPIIHHPTVNMNTDLPPPLLAAVIVIGATYSHLKRTRRFAIVLLDVVRWHLRIALECDNNLMRDPMIIYAQALICHAGIWIGNKRSFELAEVVRGALVTYIRRLRFGKELNIKPENNGKLSVQEEWRQWIKEEQQKRLAWVVYALDCQFPSILNLPPTISLGEIRDLGCPCDDEFWFATSARHWKNLLGPASMPPSRPFSAAMGPFLVLTMLPSTINSTQKHKIVTDRVPVLNLNAWSAFLVLMALQHQIFEFHQELMITRSFIDDEVDELHSSEEQASIKILKEMHIMRRSQLAEALSLFSESYLSPQRLNPSTNTSSAHFYASSLVIQHLSVILLDVPLSDLQSAIGKDGISGITQGLSNLSTWAHSSPLVAQTVAFNAIRTIIFLAPSSSSSTNADTAPYSLITIFLCHIVLYVFTQVASREQNIDLLKLSDQSIEIRGNSFLEILKRACGLGEKEEPEPNLLLRSAAERLTWLGTWGAALNLAMMLQKRAEM